MMGSVLALGEGRKVMVMAPLARSRKGANSDAFAAIRRAGLIRARVDGAIVEIGPDDPKLAKTKAHHIEAIVDRLVVREGVRARLGEGLDLALKLGEGTVVLAIQDGDGWEDRALSTHFACPDCHIGLTEVEPRTFSFNSPHGACPSCQGLGQVRAFDESLVLPDRSRTLGSGAVATWEFARPDEGAFQAFLRRQQKIAKKALRDGRGFNMLVELGATDYLGYPGRDASAPRFEVHYVVRNIDTLETVIVKVGVDDPAPVLPSVCPVWRGADWMEREVFDMYGIKFDGHPDLRRVLMPDEFTAFPLRKDYPLRGRGERHNFPRILREQS